MKTKILLVLLTFFATAIVFAGTIDENLSKIGQCDDFFPCQQNGHGESKVKMHFRSNLGVGFDTDPTPLPSELQRPRIPDPNPSNHGKRSQPEKTESSVNSSTDSERVDAIRESRKQSSNEAQNWGGYGGNLGSDSNSDLGSMNTSGSFINGSSPNVRSGLLYSNDSPSINQKNQEMSQELSGEELNSSYLPNPIEQNRKSESPSADREVASSNSSNQAQAGSSFNGPAAGGSGVSKLKSAPQQETLIGQIAAALKDGLNSFWGGLSGSSISVNDLGQSGQKPNGHKQINTSAKFKSSDFLRANFEKYKRGLANRIEFGDSGTFIFASVCEQYKSYAKSNRIPNHKSECPIN